MKKVTLGVVMLGLVFLSACNANSQTKSSETSSISTQETEKSTTQTSLTSTSDSSKSTATQETVDSSAVSSQLNNTTSYQAILDEYALKIRNATPGLIQEFRNEAAANTSGVEGLAAISNNKVERLAMISTEGVNQMASLHYSQSDDYSVYESWANQLINVYTEESQKIIGEYLATSTATNSASPGATPSTPVNPSTTPPSEPTVTTTVQAGESPQDIANRSGISVDVLFNLNGMDPNNYMLYPGQELRIK